MAAVAGKALLSMLFYPCTCPLAFFKCTWFGGDEGNPCPLSRVGNGLDADQIMHLISVFIFSKQIHMRI
jgi:hypothetical protein